MINVNNVINVINGINVTNVINVTNETITINNEKKRCGIALLGELVSPPTIPINAPFWNGRACCLSAERV